MDEKKCSKCGEMKPPTEYYKDKSRHDGLARLCRQCDSARARKWRDANADRQRLNQRQWRMENADRDRERKRAWERENPDKHYAHTTAYHRANPHVAWASRYRDRARRVGVDPVVERFTKAEVIDRYGDSCHYCETGGFEQIDHYVPVSKGGPHTLDNVRPSCAGCNQGKSDMTADEWLAELRATA